MLHVLKSEVLIFFLGGGGCGGLGPPPPLSEFSGSAPDVAKHDLGD